MLPTVFHSTVFYWSLCLSLCLCLSLSSSLSPGPRGCDELKRCDKYGETTVLLHSTVFYYRCRREFNIPGSLCSLTDWFESYFPFEPPNIAFILYRKTTWKSVCLRNENTFSRVLFKSWHVWLIPFMRDDKCGILLSVAFCYLNPIVQTWPNYEKSIEKNVVINSMTSI